MNSDATQQLHALLKQHIRADHVPSYPVLHTRIAELAAAGADVNAVDDEGLTPLARCLSVIDPVSYGSVPMDINEVFCVTINEILKAGAVLPQNTPEGHALMQRVYTWPMDRALQVLQKHATDREHVLPPATAAALHEKRGRQILAILKTDPEVAKESLLRPLPDLLAVGADLSVRDADGYNALQLLLTRGDYTHRFAKAHDIVALLLAKGIDIDTPLPDGRTCHDLAAALDDKDGATTQRLLKGEALRRSDPYLMTHVPAVLPSWPLPTDRLDARRRDEFIFLCAHGKPDYIHYMLRTRGNAATTWTAENGNTGLLKAMFTPHPNHAIITALIAHESGINIPDNQGLTPLMHACRRVRLADFIEPLINAGADANIRCHKGLTAYDYARQPSADAGAVARLQNGVIRRAQQLAAEQEQQRQLFAQRRRFKL